MSTSTIMPSSNRSHQKIHSCHQPSLMRQSSSSSSSGEAVSMMATPLTDFKTEIPSAPSSPSGQQQQQEVSDKSFPVSSLIESKHQSETRAIISETGSKTSQVKSLLNQCLDEKSRKRISNILCEVCDLSDIEKLVLYMQLPTTASDSSHCLPVGGGGGEGVTNHNELVSIGNQQSPLTPPISGNRLKSPGCVSGAGKKAEIEVAQTYAWIKSHLEEDSSFSLPKQEVYDDYKAFCQASKFDALCVADFGKAMKQVFPGVKPRRLGQRGNSKYCYSGLKKKFIVETTVLPKIDLNATLTDEPGLDRFLSTISCQDILNMIRHEKMGVNEIQGKGVSNENSDQPLKALFQMIVKYVEGVSSMRFNSIRDFFSHLLKNQSSNFLAITNGPAVSSRDSNVSQSNGRPSTQTLTRSKSLSGRLANPSMNGPQNLVDKVASSCLPVGFTSPPSSSVQSLNLRPSRSKSLIESGSHFYQHDLSSNCLTGQMTAPSSSSSSLQKYKTIQPKPSDCKGMICVSSAPATASSSPTQMQRTSSKSVKRKLSSPTDAMNGSQFGMTCSRNETYCQSSKEPFMRHPQKEEEETRKKQCRLASIQSVNQRQKSLSSSCGSSSVDSGIHTPTTGSTVLTPASSASFPLPSHDSGLTSTGVENFFEFSSEGLPASSTSVFDLYSSERSFLTQNLTEDSNCNPCVSTVASPPDDRLGSIPPSFSSSLGSFAGGPNGDARDSICDAGNTASLSRGSSSSTDLESKSNLDRHQLSQLRKLLEQNLPQNRGLKEPTSSFQAASGSTSCSITNQEDSRFTENVTLNSTLEGTGLLPESSLFNQEVNSQVYSGEAVDSLNTASSAINGMTGSLSNDSGPSSVGNPVSLTDTPMMMSQANSPVVQMADQGMHNMNGGHIDPMIHNEDQNYMFQPISQASNSPVSLMNETIFLNDSPPLTHSIAVGTTTGSNSPESMSPPQTSQADLCRSRNDSGHSLHSSFDANSTLITNGNRLDSGLSSFSGSPFMSPLGTPVPVNHNRSVSGPCQRNLSVNRTRHSSGPGHFSQQRMPVMRANSYSPLASYQHQAIPPDAVFSGVYRPRDSRNSLPGQSLETLHEGVSSASDDRNRGHGNNRSRHFSSPFCSLTGNSHLQHLQTTRSCSPSLTPNFLRSNSVPAFEQNNNPIKNTLLWSDTSSRDPRSSYPTTPTSVHGSSSFLDMLPSHTNEGVSIGSQEEAGHEEDTKPNEWDLHEEGGKSRGVQRNISHLLSLTSSSSLDEDQDLQTTLDDLRDCDNDFSRFAQELEQQQEDVSGEMQDKTPSSSS